MGADEAICAGDKDTLANLEGIGVLGGHGY